MWPLQQSENTAKKIERGECFDYTHTLLHSILIWQEGGTRITLVTNNFKCKFTGQSHTVFDLLQFIQMLRFEYIHRGKMLELNDIV